MTQLLLIKKVNNLKLYWYDSKNHSGFLIDIIPVNNCPDISVSSVPADKVYLSEFEDKIAMGICILLYFVHLIHNSFTHQDIFDDMDEVPNHKGTVTLEVRPSNAGVLTLTNTVGVSFIVGDGTADNYIQISGNAESLKQVLTAPWYILCTSC